MASPEANDAQDKDAEAPPAESLEDVTSEDGSSSESPSGSKSLLHGSDIAALLRSEGPTVKAVLLRHMRRDGHLDDLKMPAVDEKEDSHRPILEELIDELEIDTTPSRNHVKEVLGGDFTFLGQWPSEGTIAIGLKDFTEDLPSDLTKVSIKVLRQHCHNLGTDTASMIEKGELISVLEEKRSQALPLNPHLLQPPLHNINARGDILVMKVADNDEDSDNDKEPERAKIMSNEEFFLDYTKEEYLHFTSRTDIFAAEPEVCDDDDDDDDDDEQEAEVEDSNKHGDDDDDEEDEDYQPEELDSHSLMNIILGGVIQKFREENGRGPNTQELLELRSVIASELDVEVAPVPAEDEDEKKRPAQDSSDAAERSNKRVKFSPEAIESTGDSLGVNYGDKKPDATESPNEKNGEDESKIEPPYGPIEKNGEDINEGALTNGSKASAARDESNDS